MAEANSTHDTIICRKPADQSDSPAEAKDYPSFANDIVYDLHAIRAVAKGVLLHLESLDYSETDETIASAGFLLSDIEDKLNAMVTRLDTSRYVYAAKDEVAPSE